LLLCISDDLKEANELAEKLLYSSNIDSDHSDCDPDEPKRKRSKHHKYIQSDDEGDDEDEILSTQNKSKQQNHGRKKGASANERLGSPVSKQPIPIRQTISNISSSQKAASGQSSCQIDKGQLVSRESDTPRRESANTSASFSTPTSTLVRTTATPLAHSASIAQILDEGPARAIDSYNAEHINTPFINRFLGIHQN
jgi:hypothetical protein